MARRYTDFVRRLAELCLHFGRPVLLINGDSHLFEADRPLADPNSTTGLIHGTPAVPNLTRITVQGSTNKQGVAAFDDRSPLAVGLQLGNVIDCDELAGAR